MGVITDQKEEEILTFQGETVLFLEITLPRWEGNKKREKRLQRYYCKFSQIWKNIWCSELYFLACLNFLEKRDKGLFFTPWRCVIESSWEEGILTDNYLSVGVTVKEKRGKSLWEIYFFSDLWDISEGSPISLNQFVPQVFGKNILTEIFKQGEEREDFFFFSKDLQEIRKHFSFKNIFFTQEGGEFFFPQGSIAPKVEGIPRFFLPYEQK
ncbi:MAG: RsiV family protein [Eubacteriales bacterium]